MQADRIILGNGNVALISPEDAEFCGRFTWCQDSMGYLITWIGGTGKLKRLHTLLMGPPKGMVTDHINRDKLDNRRENLRVVAYKINSINRTYRARHSSGRRGVWWKKRERRWVAQINRQGKTIYLGMSADLAVAIGMREKAERMEYTQEELKSMEVR